MINLTKNLFVCALLFATAARAQPVGEVIVGSGISSLGSNIEATYQFDPNFRLRGLLLGIPSFGDNSQNLELDGTTYDYEASVRAFATLIDYYPNNSGWRISGGLLFNRSEFNAAATLAANNPFTLDDGTIFDSGTASLDFEFNKTVSPMVTAGYDYRLGEKWVLSGELGAIYVDGLSLVASSTNAALQAEIEDESSIQDARDDADEVTFYPYIAFTVSNRF